jgi:ABC-2 type transport system permease protein
MTMPLTWVLTKTFLRIFSRDRQAIFFSLFFPLVFMGVFGLVGSGGQDPFEIGIVDEAGSPLSGEFLRLLQDTPSFAVTVGNESELREQVLRGDLKMLLIVPAGFEDNQNTTELTLVVDSAQVQELGLIMPLLENLLVEVERGLRNEQALFTLTIEDVKARSQNYLSFLVPGLLAFTIMQISIAGSGYNIVEFRRKGILKRLFVTPLHSADFIGGLVISRSLICLVQIVLLLAIAIFIFDISIMGHPLSLLLVVLAGTALFLSVGFCMGSLAKTQQSIMAIGNLVTFPQMFLSGIFYPIDILPALIQPIAQILPLSFLVSALRALMVDDASLAHIAWNLLGLIVWTGVALFLAIRMFVWKEVAA